MIREALVLPTPPALLPPFSRCDPVADLRKACLEALAELLASRPTDLWVVSAPVGAANLARGVTDPLGHRVARHLLAGSGRELPPVHEVVAGDAATDGLRSAGGVALVMADGSARRHEDAPGHLHADAVPFDTAVERALRTGDAAALVRLDDALAGEVWCEGVPAFRVLGQMALGRPVRARMTYADAPAGVAWWVAHWALG